MQKKPSLLSNLISKIIISLIQWYQRFLSPDHSLNSSHRLFCRFIPTCSEYAIGCFKQYHWFKASYKTLWRVVRCLPGRPVKIELP